MLLFVCLAFGATAVVVTLRWSMARVDTIGRPRPFPSLSVSAAAAAAVLCAVPIVRHARLEAELERVASRLAGRQVSVNCETVGAAWLQAHPERGYVRFGADGVPEAATTITYDTCRDLSDWVGSDHADASQDQVIAVHVLTHESMHMAGIADEGRAECAALQRDHLTATLFGAPDEAARDLARRYLREVYPRLPAEYRAPQCEPGGEYDEHLKNPPWT